MELQRATEIAEALERDILKAKVTNGGLRTVQLRIKTQSPMKLNAGTTTVRARPGSKDNYHSGPHIFRIVYLMI